MTIYSVFSKSATNAGVPYEGRHFSVSSAKKEMKRLIALGHPDTTGSKTKVWSNGEWEPCGEITLTGSNKTMIANTRQRKPGILRHKPI